MICQMSVCQMYCLSNVHLPNALEPQNLVNCQQIKRLSCIQAFSYSFETFQWIDNDKCFIDVGFSIYIMRLSVATFLDKNFNLKIVIGSDHSITSKNSLDDIRYRFYLVDYKSRQVSLLPIPYPEQQLGKY